MLTESWAQRIASRRATLDRLIRETGITRYGLFGVSSEGKNLPDGSVAASGLVVDQDGQVFSFWLDWDDARGCVALTEWRRVEPEADWLNDEEYVAARRAAGLT